jgi:hypothetical protein
LGATVHLKSNAALWIGILVPPMAWAADLTTSYAMVKWACGHHTRALLHVNTLVTLALIAAAGMTAWSAERENERAEFMVRFGLAASVLFFLVTLALAIPKWLVDVCL